jgi:hypothetical protein
MDVKTCRKCHQPKPLDQFYPTYRSESHRNVCKDCHLIANRQWRQTHRKRHNAKSLKWYYNNPEKARQMNANNYQLQNERRDRIQAMIFDDYPCLVCGDKRHGCLTFHHLDPKAKESGVTSHSLTWRKMLREAAKCIVLCRNCHGLYHCGDIQLPEKLTPIDAEKYYPRNLLLSP